MKLNCFPSKVQRLPTLPRSKFPPNKNKNLHDNSKVIINLFNNNKVHLPSFTFLSKPSS